MSSEPGPPGPIACLQRGLRSLRANWELAPLLLIQTLLSIALTVAGGLVLLAGFGVSVVGWLRGLGPDWPRRLGEDLLAALEGAPPELLPLLAPLVAATLVWTLAFVLFCYLQGGVMGILAEAEMGAAAGLPAWREFRRFSAAGFDRHGRRLFWRYFWLAHLLAVVGLAWLVLAAGLAAVALSLAAGSEVTAGVAVGCFGVVPLALTLFALALWSMLATVEVARPGASVRRAAGRALAVLRRRLGGALVIWLLALAGWMMVGAAFAPLGWWIAVAAGDRFVVWVGGRGALLVAEMLADSALTVVLFATLAAWVGLRPAAEVSR